MKGIRMREAMGEVFDEKVKPVSGRVMSFDQSLFKIRSLSKKGCIF